MEKQQTITLNYAVESYLNHLCDLNKKEATVNIYKRALDIALLYFGTEKDIAGITLPMAGKFFKSDQLNVHPNGKPKAVPTVKQIKRVFRQCLEYAKDQGWVQNLNIPKSELQHARSKKTSQELETPKMEPTKEIAEKTKNNDDEKTAAQN